MKQRKQISLFPPNRQKKPFSLRLILKLQKNYLLSQLIPQLQLKPQTPLLSQLIPLPRLRSQTPPLPPQPIPQPQLRPQTPLQQLRSIPAPK